MCYQVAEEALPPPAGRAAAPAQPRCGLQQAQVALLVLRPGLKLGLKLGLVWQLPRLQRPQRTAQLLDPLGTLGQERLELKPPLAQQKLLARRELPPAPLLELSRRLVALRPVGTTLEARGGMSRQAVQPPAKAPIVHLRLWKWWLPQTKQLAQTLHLGLI
ncbi:unnamed protein product [Effrenium voratum]|uniref:Uncharacterized protein n=1 Tax=Effrenium voratum TaxID=2562239 RepID=A0AA36MZ34_9DINO|nr:unnamed protein product [Effrenium voratum]